MGNPRVRNGGSPVLVEARYAGYRIAMRTHRERGRQEVSMIIRAAGQHVGVEVIISGKMSATGEELKTTL